MSGVGNVSNQSYYVSQLQASLQSASETDEVARSEQIDQTEMREKMEAELDVALDSAGVSEETQEALKTDLAQAFEEQLASGEFPPDPEAMKQTIDDIFSQYDLNAEEFMPSGGPGGPPPDGMGGGMSAAQGSTDTTQTDLLEMLLQNMEKQNDGTLDLSQISQELSQIICDALFGFDEEA